MIEKQFTRRVQFVNNRLPTPEGGGIVLLQTLRFNANHINSVDKFIDDFKCFLVINSVLSTRFAKAGGV